MDISDILDKILIDQKLIKTYENIRKKLLKMKLEV